MNESIAASPPRLGYSVVQANMIGADAILTVADFLFVVFQLIALHAALVHDTRMQVHIIGVNSVAALLFDNRHTAGETLAALEISPSLCATGIFNALHKPLALYQHGNAAQVRTPDATMLREPDVSTFTALKVVKLVELERHAIGCVVVRSSLSELCV